MTSTPLTTSDISVIIPTLNEEKSISALLDQLRDRVGEIIIVDGGSTDSTVSTARNRGFQVIKSPAGRGIQLNRGAAASSGKILFFLHADSRLPDSFAHDILNLINCTDVLVGTFRLAVDTSNLFLQLVIFSANLRSSWLNLPYGDQGFFLTRGNFDRLGGFPQVKIMEDYIFIRGARKKGKIVTLNKSVTTSGRRWKRLGVFRTTAINWLMLIGYTAGISPEKLASFYRR